MSKTPEIARIEPSVRDGMAVGQTAMSVFTRELYYLAIVDVSNGKDKAKVASNKTPLSIGPASAASNNTSPEYYFVMPPKVHEMSEPFATNIVMTQNGGKYVESQGSPLKEIRLSGTTGLRPNKNSNTLKLFGLDTGFSGTLAQTISLAGLGSTPDLVGSIGGVVNVFTKPSPWAAGEAIGHDHIIFLRNLFRLYAWQKENAPNAASICMIWRNIKDGDYWLVEPTEFKLSQNSSSPLTYEYSISLKTLAPFDYRVVLSKDPMQFSKDASAFISRVNQSTQVIKQSFLAVANQVDRFARVPFNFSTFILGPMVSTIQGGVAVQRANGRFTSLFRSSLVTLNTNLAAYIKEAATLFPVQSALINALRKAKRATETILSDPNMKADSVGSDAQEKKQNVTDAYSTSNLVSTSTAGASGTKAFLGNQTLGNSTGQDTVKPGDTIRSIANRLLGDSTQIHVLITLNKLKAPYIAPVRGPGVLQPGDVVLYPVQLGTAPVASNLITGTTAKSADALNQTIQSQQQFGRDIRLIKVVDTNTSFVKYDIGPDKNGNIATIDGLANLGQAINIKFNVTNGELPAHPNFGALARLGSKATPTSLAGLRLNTEQTLLSDPRIADIRSLNFTILLDALYTNVSIVPQGMTSSVNLGFPLRKAT